MELFDPKGQIAFRSLVLDGSQLLLCGTANLTQVGLWIYGPQPVLFEVGGQIDLSLLAAPLTQSRRTF